MEQHYCLNCSEEVSKKFCANCGQKTDTHRVTTKHFVTHDLVHGLWHLDKGILFTLKAAVIRPGQAAMDYINGKRAPFYNVFYLSLILMGITVLLDNYIDKVHKPDALSADVQLATDYMARYLKLFLFGIVPIFAINGKLMFKRLRLNFAEHCIIGGMCLLGILLFNLWYLVFFLVEGYNISVVFEILEMITIIMILLYPSYVYYGACKKQYAIGEFLWRVILYNLLFTIQFIFLSRLIYFFITGKISIFGHAF